MGLGAVIVAVAVLGVVAWLAFLVAQTRVRRRRREAAPQNLSPFLTDDELESKRLNGVLVSALIATAVLAIVMPIYYLNESGRQASSVDRFDEIAVERGEHWFEEFQCGNCHGPSGGGGGAPYVEKRSSLNTTWAAPSINDVAYRYSEDEVRYWLVWGRQNTPMPAWGTEGGGPLNSQQIDELIAYLEHFKISQAEAVAQIDTRVEQALSRLDGADATVDAAIADQQDEIAALEATTAQYEATKDLPARLEAALSASGVCTEASARLVNKACENPAGDADRDGLSDAAEPLLDALLSEMVGAAPPSDPRTILDRIVSSAVGDLAFDPGNAFSTSEGGRRVADLDQAERMITEFAGIERDLRLTVNGLDGLMSAAEQGLEYLQEARSERAYSIDVAQIAADGFDGNVTDARRAAGLFNAYCARCHTAGYSAGVPYTQQAGSGAFGPSLREGRSVTQFPDPQDHLAFIIRGSENGQAYGVNGVGRGWMPGFGTVLTEEDLMLIVRFERALP